MAVFTVGRLFAFLALLLFVAAALRLEAPVDLVASGLALYMLAVLVWRA